MPRIGGPGGPPIPPQQTPAGTGAEKTDFASKVAQTVAPTAATGAQQAQQAQAPKGQPSQLYARTRDIAKRLERGELTQKEATREFVSLVIEERLPQFKKKKKRKQGDKDEKDTDNEGEDVEASAEEKLEEAVTEVIERDPKLAQQLRSQFKKLAASKG